MELFASTDTVTKLCELRDDLRRITSKLEILMRRPIDPRANASLDEIGLPPRYVKVLKNIGITTIEQLIPLTETELLRHHGVGRHLVNEVKESLEKISLHLGYDMFALR